MILYLYTFVNEGIYIWQILFLITQKKQLQSDR